MSQTSSDTLNATLAAAKASLHVATAYADNKGPPQPSLIDSAESAVDGLQSVVNSSTLQALEPVGTIALETMSTVQSRLDSLARTSRILAGALDELSNIHPFVAVVATAFKVAWKFEATRRQNDKRVQMVYLKMSEMLDTLLSLRKIAQDDRGKDGTLISHRLGDKMQNIAQDIKTCAAVCDAFSKKHTIVKLFQSLTWEQKLLGFIEQFTKHQETLRFELAMHASIGIEQANTAIVGVLGSLKEIDSDLSTLVLLQHLRSPKDRQLLNRIKHNGGAEKVLKNEAIMRDLISDSEDKDLQGETISSPKADAMTTILRDIGKTIDDMVKENQDVFTRKFQAQELVLKAEMAAITRREGDRVIAAVQRTMTSGPQERILDRHIHAVWTESGWKGTAKARSLVMALREHYAELLKTLTLSDHHSPNDRGPPASRGVDSSRSEMEETGSEDATLGVHPDDEWALQYISISRIQPLLEAIDDDASGLVSISEVNAFTAARPKNWRLPHWIAYWTAGHPLVLKYYFVRIQILMSRMGMAIFELHSTNLSLGDYFHTGNFVIARGLDILLAGLYDTIQDIEDDEQLFMKFKDYAVAEETKMKARLQAVLYYIDAPNTLDMVIGSGRLEHHVMPLIYLLLLRALHVLRHGRQVALHHQELTNIVMSFGVIIGDAIIPRALDLDAVIKLQGLNTKEQFKRFSYGMYYYEMLRDELKNSQYWKQVHWNPSDTFYTRLGLEYLGKNFSVCPTTYEDLSICQEDVTEDLLYDPPDDSLHEEIYSDDGRSSTWSAVYLPLKQNNETSDDLVSNVILRLRLELPKPGESGAVTGTGTSLNGDSPILGTLSGCDIVYNQHSPFRDGLVRRFQGTLSPERDTIQGVWGFPAGTNEEKENMTVPLADEDIRGRFEYRIGPIRFDFIQIDEAERVINQPRALWKFAIATVLNLVKIRKGYFSWQYLSARRRMRTRFIDLWPRLWNDNSPRPYVTSMAQVPLTQEGLEELAGLVTTLSDQDFQFYKNLCAVLQRRRVIHHRVYCDGLDCIHGGDHGIYTTRYTCLDCMTFDPETGERSDTMDFCDACRTKPRIRGHFEHVPAHSLLQCRTAEQIKVQYSDHRRAHEMLQRLRKEDNPNHPRVCSACEVEVESPYWVCNACTSRKQTTIVICMRCKEKKDQLRSPLSDLVFARRKTGKAMLPSVVANDYTDTAHGENIGAMSNKMVEEQGPASNSQMKASTEQDSAQPIDTASTGMEGPSSRVGSPEIIGNLGGDEPADTRRTSEEGNGTLEEPFPTVSSETRGTCTEAAAVEDLLVGHRYHHPLILYQPAPKIKAWEVPSLTTMVGKLETMHEHIVSLHNRVESFEARMDRLEELLRRGLRIPREDTVQAVPVLERTTTNEILSRE